jgi:hypothetical protein
MRRKDKRSAHSRDTPGGATRRVPAARHGGSAEASLRDPVVPLDAEDIALARLQAHLRRTEALQTPARRSVSAQRRTTVRLPSALLDRLRERARRDGTTTSEIVEQALERFLRPR